MKSFGRSQRNDIKDLKVDDPIAGNLDVYYKVFREIDQEIERILPLIDKVVDSAR